MRPLFGIILILAGLLTGCAQRGLNQIQGADAPMDAAPTPSLSYSVNGVDPLGTEYGGNLLVSPGNAPGTYHLQWIITGNVQEGEGYFEGNQFLTRWRTIEGLGIAVSGVTTYTMTTLGELYGQRAADGLPGVGTENAFPNDSP